MRRMLVAVCMVLLATTAGAQDEATASLDLGMDAAVPGEDASLLVALSTTGAPKIGAIRFEVLVPAHLVSFVELSKRFGAEDSRADINAELVQPTHGSDEAIVRVDVSSSNPIPEGLLVALTFDVSKQAQVGSVIKMKAGAVTARSVDGRQLRTSALDGEITVLSDLPQVLACFFYMH